MNGASGRQRRKEERFWGTLYNMLYVSKKNVSVQNFLITHHNTDANEERTFDVVMVSSCKSVHHKPLGSVGPTVNESHTVASVNNKLCMYVDICCGESDHHSNRQTRFQRHLRQRQSWIRWDCGVCWW